MQDESEVRFRFRRQYAGGCKAFVIDEGRVVHAYPSDGIWRIRDDGVKGLVFVELRIGQGIAQPDVELVVIDVVQKHVHPCQIIGCVVDFLTEITVFDKTLIEQFSGLQKE